MSRSVLIRDPTGEHAALSDQDRLGIVPSQAECHELQLGVALRDFKLRPVTVVLIIEDGAHAFRNRLPVAGGRAAKYPSIGDARIGRVK